MCAWSMSRISNRLVNYNYANAAITWVVMIWRVHTLTLTKMWLFFFSLAISSFQCFMKLGEFQFPHLLFVYSSDNFDLFVSRHSIESVIQDVWNGKRVCKLVLCSQIGSILSKMVGVFAMIVYLYIGPFFFSRNNSKQDELFALTWWVLLMDL